MAGLSNANSGDQGNRVVANEDHTMNRQGRWSRRVGCYLGVLSLAGSALFFTGCGPSYHRLRREGHMAITQGDYGPARVLLLQAEEKHPRNVKNLHDLGACSVMLANEKFNQRNHAAAMRELDAAIFYYESAIDANPGYLPAIEGRNVALKLKGEFDEALKNAEWALRYVGPSANQFLFLAAELEERGDMDGALLRYQQAVAADKNNPAIHSAFAEFLLRHNNEPAAIYHLQAAYRLNPEDPWVSQELSQRGAVPTLALGGIEAP
jgi:tetratricopeptide (TPR) repeat protein